MTDKKVKVIADGPYQVTGGVALDLLRYITNHKGYSVDYDRMKKYPERETYFLCRCGDSKNKPYCDGAHKQVGFVGTETASHAAYDDMAKCIEGKLMDLMDAEELCSVARFCDTKSGTWNLIETAEKIVLTGVYFQEEELGAATYDAHTNTTDFIAVSRIPGSYHGTGDIFASTVLAGLMNDFSLNEATRIAVRFTANSIMTTYLAGTDHRFGVNFEANIPGLLKELELV